MFCAFFSIYFISISVNSISFKRDGWIFTRNNIIKHSREKCYVQPMCDPCKAPDGLPIELNIDPFRYKTELEIEINTELSTTTVEIIGRGYPSTICTVWIVFDPLESNNPIFDIAEQATPFASTTDAFTNGRYPPNEPNYVNTNKFGDFIFKKTINFDIFKKLQVPLVAKDVRTQELFPNQIIDNDGFTYSNLNQQKYLGLNGQRVGFTGISTEYLREFDDNGTEKIDKNGNVIIPRANLKPKFLIVATHHDNRTHGADPGLGGIGGDHWDVIIWDLFTVNKECK